MKIGAGLLERMMINELADLENHKKVLINNVFVERFGRTGESRSVEQAVKELDIEIQRATDLLAKRLEKKQEFLFKMGLIDEAITELEAVRDGLEDGRYQLVKEGEKE